MSSIELTEDFRKAQKDDKPAGILKIKWGYCDAQFEVLFSAPGSKHPPIKIITAVQNVTEYPKDHEYIIFCPDDPPPQIEDALENISGTKRKTLSELLKIISTTLSSVRLDSNEDSLDLTASGGKEQSVNNEKSLSAAALRDEQYEARGEKCLEIAGSAEMLPLAMSSNATEYRDEGMGKSNDDESTDSEEEDYMVSDDDFLSSSEAREKLLTDIRLVKEAGFGILALGHLMDCRCDSYGYLVVSIPMSELGILDDVMQAWKVDPNEHLTLIIHYPKGYKTYEELQNNGDQAPTNVEMRVVASKNPILTLQEASSTFLKIKTINWQNMKENVKIREIFISKQLTALLEERLLPVLRFRSCGLDWHGAESWYSDLLAMNESSHSSAIPDIYFEPEASDKVFPDIVTADHFTSQYGAAYSFPLLAMQFVLRHFVRCTEFCLTCNRKLNLELEAIKPYFCERPLCLFQSLYLNTGFVEHEIMSQPYVVDLLVSFCYASARAHRLIEFPDGLGLIVPNKKPKSAVTYDWSVNPLGLAPPPSNALASSSGSSSSSKTTEYEVGFDSKKLEVHFYSCDTCPVNKDSWIVIKLKNLNMSAGGVKEFHCRVSEISRFPIINVDEPVYFVPSPKYKIDLSANKNPKLPLPPASPNNISNWIPATLTMYDVDFDVLSNKEKCDVICRLLNILPTVKEMQEYLAEGHPRELQNWVGRLSPAALRLFRWIIVTNRACIMQVDGDNNGSKAKQERLFGMRGYMQFRFAMGAPDKEQRFLNEVRKTAERLNLKHPTLFAFHGSPIYNWHMIIREGLHFKSVDHGRKYGDGVYHARDASTSEGYSGRYSFVSAMSKRDKAFSGVDCWPRSVLRVSSALALNEIVNAPGEFVSSSPYYVVSQLDWIQTRYLLVKCNAVPNVVNVEEQEPSSPHPQDPNFIPNGTSGPISIPASAIKSGRAMLLAGKKHEAPGESSTETKKFKSIS